MDRLEEGRRRFGLGQRRKLQLLIDRSAGADGEELCMKRMSHLQALALLRKVCSTFQDNYPETLQCAHVVPVSAFFRWVYLVFGVLIKPSSRRKIRLVDPADPAWANDLPADAIPFRLRASTTVREQE